MIHYYKYLFVKKNHSELHFFRSDFLQNPYFSNTADLVDEDVEKSLIEKNLEVPFAIWRKNGACARRISSVHSPKIHSIFFVKSQKVSFTFFL